MKSIEGECRRWLCKRARLKIVEAYDEPDERPPPRLSSSGSKDELLRLRLQLKEARASSDGFAMLQQELISAKLSIAELNYKNEEQQLKAKLERRQTYS